MWRFHFRPAYLCVGRSDPNNDPDDEGIPVAALGVALRRGVGEGRSGSLPNGTIVEVVFRNAHITNWNASGVYSGSVFSEIRVGAYTASTTSKMDSTWGTTEVPGPEVRAKLTVGNRYSFQSKLRLYGRAFYFAAGPIYDGVIHIDTTANVEMDPLGQDVTVQFDSDL